MSLPAEDELSAASLAADCAAEGIAAPGQLLVFDEIDSTNAELLRRLSAAGALHKADGSLSAAGTEMHRLVAAAAFQTAGRGRVGRTFYSPAGSGIYFSFVYVPDGCVRDPAAYTVPAAVGVCRAVESLFGVQAQIKWVNDVYVRGRKVCGILTEGFASPRTGNVEAVVVGIGINIRQDPSLPAELAQRAGGILADGSASPVTRSRLLARCLAEIFRLLDAGGSGSKEADGSSSSGDAPRVCIPAIGEYRSRSLLIGKTLTVSAVAGDSGSQYDALATGISDDAGLCVRLADGSVRILRSGEVTLHFSRNS